jgi:hypothetical protein
MEVLLGILIGGGALLAIGYPIWKPAPWSVGATGGPASQVTLLEERKELTYAAIRELGFDFRTDKLSEDDYQIEMGRLKSEAVAIVRQIDEISSVRPTGSEDLEREIAAVRAQIAPPVQPRQMVAEEAPATASSGLQGVPGDGPFCTQCGRQAGSQDRFCAGCGTQLREIQ